MEDYRKKEEEEAKQAIRKLASIKAKPYVDKTSEQIQKKAKLKLSDLGVDEDYMKYAAGAAGLADALQKQELEGSVNLTDDLELEGKISPREKAIKLLYNKSF